MPSGSENSQPRLLSELGLFLARFCLSAWLGAASLFVIVGIIEVTRGGFDSTTKDQLVTLRFPAFYSCGVVLMVTSGFGAWLAGASAAFPARRRSVSLILIAVALGLMAVDYAYVYLPLWRMVSPPGQAKPSGFAAYHDASKKTNLAGLVTCLAATGLINWPVRHRDANESDLQTRKQVGD